MIDHDVCKSYHLICTKFCLYPPFQIHNHVWYMASLPLTLTHEFAGHAHKTAHAAYKAHHVSRCAVWQKTQRREHHVPEPPPPISLFIYILRACARQSMALQLTPERRVSPSVPRWQQHSACSRRSRRSLVQTAGRKVSLPAPLPCQ